MGKKTRALCLAALFTALSVAILYFASIWPTGQLGFAAAASLFVAAAVIEIGLGPGLYVYIAGSALCMLLLPNRAAPLLFVSFFGYYPVVKSVIERIRGAVVQWALKLIVFNIALSVIWFLLRGIIFNFGDIELNAIFIYIGGNVVFAVFDYGFSKVLWLYINRVSRFTRD
jgi:hypothetical protein